MPRRPVKPTKGSPKTAGDRNTLRIIGGRWRARKLAFPSLDGLRPTGDRIRETLFNWLTADLPASRCLDLFAGSGALGLEALSRGADQVTLIEQNHTAANYLRQHLSTLGTEAGKIVQADTLTWLQQHPVPMDIVFIDPPFQADLWPDVFKALEGGWLKSGSAIYVEAPRDYTIAPPSNWSLHREKHTGHVSFRLYFRD
jgi:16S rRNA (guanine966-N2)-methyltransferase